MGVLLGIGCSQTTNYNAECGAGTTLVNGTCEIVGDGGMDGTISLLMPEGAASDVAESDVVRTTADGGDAGGKTDAGNTNADAATGVSTDFPALPVLDPGGPLPAGFDPSTVFAGDGGTATGPCLSEPANGALYPYNWQRPRVYWSPPASQTVFEVRVSSPTEVNDYVVYTTNHYWVMDLPTWQRVAGVKGGAAGTLVGQDLTFVVRGVSASGGAVAISNSATITIAPAAADGALVFWATASLASGVATTNLEGFHVGEEGTAPVLSPAQVQQQVWAPPPDGGNFPNPPASEPVGCIGCHTPTPDGDYVAFTAQWPWPGALASVQSGATGTVPPWLTAGAAANLSPNTNDSNYLGGGYITTTNDVDNVELGIQTFSPAHYTTGDRIEIASIGSAQDQPDNSAGVQQPLQPACVGGTSPCVVSQLVWIDLEWTGNGATSRPTAAPGATNNGGWGILARTGDAANRSAATPSWSHDGNAIAYTSVIGGTRDGRLDLPTSGSADIETIPYSANAGAPGGAGGTARLLAGASDPSYSEYYPAFSPDDQLIAYDRIPASAVMYAQPLGEVFVVPYNGGAGGTATRVVANDPVACTGIVSPGVENSWPKWAPTSQTVNGSTYYWLVFSSTRSVTAGATTTTPGRSQLYVAGVVVDGQGNITTHAPIYPWNQDETVNNMLPAWAEFSIPAGTTTPPPPP
jgi:hypothetical protein